MEDKQEDTLKSLLRRIDLMQQQITLQNPYKDGEAEPVIALKAKVFRAQVKIDRVWGYLSFEIPEGYKLKRLRGDIEKMLDQDVPFFESTWRPRRRRTPVKRLPEK